MSAHKVILSSCSTFFKDIFIKNPHQHPLIYLNGININDLQKILTFIYCGEVEINKDLINEFLNLSNDLEIDGLKKAPDTGERGVDANLLFPTNQANVNLKTRKDIVEETSKVEKYDSTEENLESVIIEEDPQIYPEQVITINTIKKEIYEELITDFSCDQCMFKANTRLPMLKHRKNEHQEAERNFNCIQCGKQFVTRQSLKIH